jgi:hypothetical protein
MVADNGAWALDLSETRVALFTFASAVQPVAILGTAFSLVHLLDHLVEKRLRFRLPPGSRVMETGGYKGRSRSLSRADLQLLITQRLGVPPTHIISEYGMCELSSQAYSATTNSDQSSSATTPTPGAAQPFFFPPWARIQIVSPETGGELPEGETGLIRVFDLANVYSVMAVQTDDLGIRRGAGFELIGRSAQAEPRGCSLTAQADTPESPWFNGQQHEPAQFFPGRPAG